MVGSHSAEKCHCKNNSQQIEAHIARNVFPALLVSDNGSQLCSAVFQRFLKNLGIQHIISASYHPQGNAVVESFHGTLNKLIARVVEAKGNWEEVVPMAL